MANMKALVYAGVNKPEIQERPVPTIREPTDAIIKMKYGTICGTDLHILKGDVPTCKPGTILGHEGVGQIEKLGDSVKGLKVGDTVIISAISACMACENCLKLMTSHCETGGWILGHKIDGTQAEYVRVPHAGTSVFKVPSGIDPKVAFTLSDAFPTGMEAGTINACVQPGSTVAIIGGGPVGLAVLMTAKLYSPSEVVVIDLDDNRLAQAKAMGATAVANPGNMTSEEIMDKFTGGKGFDCVIEAVGVPKTFEMSQDIIAAGGNLANLGVHGKPVDLHLEKLWDRNFALRSKLVDGTTIPMLIRLSDKNILKPELLVSHYFKWSEMEHAYKVFGAAAENKALKMCIEF
ncbi:hypothetical protein KEM55_007159 [Ascosphaera atra]|nr:hypothetical protein KEM55_007159 [Ascosphaera atra]